MSPMEVSAILTPLPNLVTGAAGALVFFDYVITLRQEIDSVWRRKISAASLLFMLNRYAILGKAILDVYGTWNSGCRMSELFVLGFSTLDNYTISIFSSLRVWAIWGREWRPFLLVLPFTLVYPTLNLYLNVTSTVGVTYSGLPPPLSGCTLHINVSQVLQFRFYVAISCINIASHLIVLSLTWLKTYDIYRIARQANFKPPVTSLVLRDGTIYFGVLLALNILMLTFVKTDSRISSSVVTFTQTLPSLLISRFILSLRGLLSGSSATSLAPTVARTRGSLRFVPRAEILESLGAPIDLATFDGEAGSYEDEDEEQHNYEAVGRYLQSDVVLPGGGGGDQVGEGAVRPSQDDDRTRLDHDLLAIDITDDSPLALGLLAVLYADMMHRAV